MALSYVISTVPVPLLSLGGTSSDALRSAFKLTGAAIDGAAKASAAVKARAASADRKNGEVMFVLPGIGFSAKEANPIGRQLFR